MQSADRARSLARLSARLITVRSRVQIASGPSLFRGIVVLICDFSRPPKIRTAYGRQGDRLEDQNSAYLPEPTSASDDSKRL